MEIPVPKFNVISPGELEKCLAMPDLTQDSEHAVGKLYGALEQAVRSASRDDVRTVRKSPIVSIREHFDDLLVSPNAGVRSSRNTRYIDGEHMLRGHSASLLPGEIVDFSNGNDTSATLICPALCFRSKKSDAQHASELHQVDIWHLQKDAPIDAEYVSALSQSIAQTLIPDGRFSAQPLADVSKTHPYLAEGFKSKLIQDNGTITLFEGGVVNPQLFAHLGVDQPLYGIAFGVILERSVMLRKELPDVRLIRSTQPKIQSQMSNLDRYVDPSNIEYSRTISVGVYPDSLDTLHNNIRTYAAEELGVDCTAVVGEVTPATELPPHVLRRLGMTAAHVNAIINLTFTSASETERSAINELRDAIYRHAHQGTEGYVT